MRILLVEDDDMIGDSVRKGLRHDGFAIDWVRNGEAVVHAIMAPSAASTELDSTLSDLMLLDLGLSKCDGFDVVCEVRQRGIAIPILILTARGTVVDHVVGLSAGAGDYLVKPFNLQGLAAHMHTLSRRQGGRTDPLMRHGEVLLSPATREMLRIGVSVKLSGRKSTMLHALLVQLGEVWSIVQLQDDLCDWGKEVGSNTVEVYIHALCKKLGNRLIQNIRDVGYVILREASASPTGPADGDVHQ